MGIRRERLLRRSPRWRVEEVMAAKGGRLPLSRWRLMGEVIGINDQDIVVGDGWDESSACFWLSVA